MKNLLLKLISSAIIMLTGLVTLSSKPLKPGSIINYTYNEVKFKFMVLEYNELEMMYNGDLDGDIVIPAGLYYDGEVYTVTTIGCNSLSSRKIRSITFPHTISTLVSPFGEEETSNNSLFAFGEEETSNNSLLEFDGDLISLKFNSQPLYYFGSIPRYNIFRNIESIRIEEDKRVGLLPIDTLSTSQYLSSEFLSVKHRKSGKVGIADYDMQMVIPCEYDEFGAMVTADFEDIGPVCGFVMKKGNRWGLIDTYGNAVIPFKYKTAEKVGKKEALPQKFIKSFNKFHVDTSAVMAQEQWATKCDANIPYLMWLARHPSQKDLRRSNEEPSFHSQLVVLVDNILRGGISLTEIPNLQVWMSKVYSHNLIELFNESGLLTTTLRDTVDMEIYNGMYTGQIDDMGLPHGYGNFIINDSSTSRRVVEQVLWIRGQAAGNMTIKLQHKHNDQWKNDRTIKGFFSSINSDPLGRSTILFDSGKYNGEIRDWSMHGSGHLVYTDGRTFNGTFRDNEFVEGSVTLNIVPGKPDWISYVGGWKDGKPHGKGKSVYTNGDTYEGVFASGFMDGLGKFVRADGCYRNGYFIADEFDKGSECWVYEDFNLKYEGQIKNGIKHGKGKCSLPNDVYYEGEFSNGHMHGVGKLVYGNGDYVDGIFRDGKFIAGVVNYNHCNVPGKPYWISFVGGWKDGEPHGKGKCKSLGGDIIEGEWVKGLVNGRAKLEGEGLKADATYKDGRFEGPATLYYSNGDVEKCFFRKDKRHGISTYTSANGQVKRRKYGNAEYLLVNDETSLVQIVPYYGKSVTYKVDTDWNEYDITSLPSWAKLISKDSKSFTIRYTVNPLQDRKRVAKVYVTADNCSVLIVISQDEDNRSRSRR